MFYFLRFQKQKQKQKTKNKTKQKTENNLMSLYNVVNNMFV